MHHPILVYGLTGYGIFVAAALYLWQRLYLVRLTDPSTQTQRGVGRHHENSTTRAGGAAKARGCHRN